MATFSRSASMLLWLFCFCRSCLCETRCDVRKNSRWFPRMRWRACDDWITGSAKLSFTEPRTRWCRRDSLWQVSSAVTDVFRAASSAQSVTWGTPPHLLRGRLLWRNHFSVSLWKIKQKIWAKIHKKHKWPLLWCLIFTQKRWNSRHLK